MKKIVSLLLALVLALSLAACAATQAKPYESVNIRLGGLKGPTSMGMAKLLDDAENGRTANTYTFTMAPSAGELTPQLIKGELDITVPVSRAYTGSGKISARPEQLFFSESGMPGTILFSTFLGDFIEYEVQLDDGQNLIVNEYTKDTTEIHSDGEQVHLSFDPMRISLYDKSEEVLSL